MGKTLLAGVVLLVALPVFGAGPEPFSPGARIMVLGHNAYPDKGKWADRLDRALSSGMPVAIEIDLCWGVDPATGKIGSFVTDDSHVTGVPSVTGGEPTLKSYFFKRVQPIVEEALKRNEKKNWPLITLFLDIKNDPPEHLESIWKELGEFEGWLTTAVKTEDAARQSPLDLKPLLVLVQDKDNDIKQEYFYDRLPIGSKLRAFGSATLRVPPGSPKDLKTKQLVQLQAKMKLEDRVTERASNYRRWWSNSWAMVEPGDLLQAGEWTPEKEARLKAAVNYAHELGYLVNFWVLDGFEPGKGLGWDSDTNFGSLQAAMTRWKAAIRAKADFISTDQYEEVAKLIARAPQAR